MVAHGRDGLPLPPIYHAFVATKLPAVKILLKAGASLDVKVCVKGHLEAHPADPDNPRGGEIVAADFEQVIRELKIPVIIFLLPPETRSPCFMMLLVCYFFLSFFFLFFFFFLLFSGDVRA